MDIALVIAIGNKSNMFCLIETGQTGVVLSRFEIRRFSSPYAHCLSIEIPFPPENAHPTLFSIKPTWYRNTSTTITYFIRTIPPPPFYFPPELHRQPIKPGSGQMVQKNQKDCISSTRNPNILHCICVCVLRAHSPGGCWY